MGGAMIDFDVRELSVLARKLNDMTLSEADRKRLLGSLGLEIEEQTKERFATQKTPDGDEWKDILESTRKTYLKKYNGSIPGSLLNRSSPGLFTTIESQVKSWDVLVGATRDYAEFLQNGTTKMTARPFIGLNSTDIADLGDFVDQFIKEKTA